MKNSLSHDANTFRVLTSLLKYKGKRDAAKIKMLFWLFMLDFIFNRCAILCINGYQKYISPRKGWNCAYRKLHGGDGCSGYVKRAIAEHGWCGAISLSQQRFADCKAAAIELHSRAQLASAHTPCAQKSSRSSRKAKRTKDSHSFCDCIPHHGCCDIVDVCVDTGPGDSGCFDCNCSS